MLTQPRRHEDREGGREEFNTTTSFNFDFLRGFSSRHRAFAVSVRSACAPALPDVTRRRCGFVAVTVDPFGAGVVFGEGVDAAAAGDAVGTGIAVEDIASV